MNVTDWLTAARFLWRARKPQNACLPQHEPDVAGRTLWLALGHGHYRHREEHDNLIHPIPTAAAFPQAIEIWKLGWALGIAPRALATVVNVQPKRLALRVIERFKEDYDKPSAYRFLFSDRLRQGRPPHYDTAGEDWAFALERLDGANPVVIARATDEHLEHFEGLTDAKLAAALDRPEASVRHERDRGHFFVADYRLLSQALLPAERPPLPRRDSRWRLKYLPAPVALFLRRPGHFEQCELVPIAIFIDQPGCRPPNPLYLRGDPGWEVAKAYVRVADANFHENISHNTRHHFVGNAFALATRRRLAINHPVHVLLEPHLAHTLMVNSVIYGTLTKRHKSTEDQFAGDLAESRQQMIEAWKEWSWPDLLLERDLTTRGVVDEPTVYPWRDDLALWPPVIEAFVRSYVRAHYPCDEELSRDHELGAWLHELGDPVGGPLRGVLRGIPTVDELIRVLSGFLFLAGPSHATVHFSLEQWLKWAPAFSRGAYAPPPAPPSWVVDHHEMLPPSTLAADQFQIGHLSGHRFGRFGDYRRYRLGRSPAAQPAIAALHRGLRQIAQTIEHRNGDLTSSGRARPYPYAHPSLVPNSINL